MTYRGDEAQPALSQLVADLDRERLATELGLERLEAADSHTMVRAILGATRPVRQEFVMAVHRLTEGNPFFIEEVLRSVQPQAARDSELDSQGISIPRTVREAVRRRFVKLSEQAQAIARYAAVAGRRFDLDLLQRICATDEQTLIGCLRELVAEGLIVEDAADLFAFRHALTREAVYSGLLATERKHLHRAIGEALEARAAGEADAGDLGYHFLEAEQWAKALNYAARAAAQAERMYVPQAVVDHYSHAITCAQRLAKPAPSELHRGRGLGYEALGDFAKAKADHEAALDLARGCGDRHSEWQALLDLGMLWAARDYARTGDYFREAFELAESMGDQAALAGSMNRLGNWHLNVEQPVEALHFHRQALALFEALQNSRGVAETLDLLGMASYLGGDLIHGAAYYRDAIRMFRKLGDRQGLASALATFLLYGRSNYHTETMVAAPVTTAEALAAGQEALEIARDTGWRAAESYALWNRALLLGVQGRYGEAIAMAEAGHDLAVEIEHRQWIAASAIALGAIYWDLMVYREAEAQLVPAVELADESGSMHWIRNGRGLLASTCLEQGDPDRAEAIIAGLVSPETSARTVGERLTWCTAAELALAQGKPERALEIIERLRAYAMNLSEGPLGPRFALLAVLALTASGMPDEAEAELRKGIALASDEGSRGKLWRLLLALGRLFQANDRPSEAEDCFEQAARAVRDLAPNVPDALREGFLAAAAARLPRTQATALRRRMAAPDSTWGLTARERDVALLIARGRSNRAIAEELVLSERTIESHVSNMLGKLGFTSRAQIAAWTVEKGVSAG